MYVQFSHTHTHTCIHTHTTHTHTAEVLFLNYLCVVRVYVCVCVDVCRSIRPMLDIVCTHATDPVPCGLQYDSSRPQSQARNGRRRIRLKPILGVCVSADLPRLPPPPNLHIVMIYDHGGYLDRSPLEHAMMTCSGTGSGSLSTTLARSISPLGIHHYDL